MHSGPQPNYLGFMALCLTPIAPPCFGGDLVPNTNSGSLFNFPHHCGMELYEIY